MSVLRKVYGVALVASFPLLAAASIGVVQRPPDSFHGDRTVYVNFSGENMDARCQRIIDQTPTEGYKFEACWADNTIWMPNPCLHREPYADLLCHELGHANGWKHETG